MEIRRLARVLHVIATLDPAGAEGQLVALCRRMDRERFEPMVCCLTRGGPLEAPLADADVPVRVLHKRGRWDLRALCRLTGVISETRPDIVHTWLPTANLLGGIATRLHGKEIAWVTSERAADVWKGRLRRWADRHLARRAARIICNAHALRRFLIARGLPGERIEVIYNGIDVDEFDRQASRTSAPLPESDGPVIGTVARLEPQKGIPYLIEAFGLLHQRFPTAHLWVVGDGPMKASLTRQCESGGVGRNVHFLGLREDVPAILRKMDLFVLPSLWEGLPNAVLEAMAARRAVVATRVDGTPEAVEENETGLLVPPRDAVTLENAMARLLADHDLRARFGEAGRQRVSREFDMSRMVVRTQQLYEHVLTRAGKREG